MALESNKNCATCRFMKPGHTDEECASCVAFCNWRSVDIPFNFSGMAVGGPLAGRGIVHTTPLFTFTSLSGPVLVSTEMGEYRAPEQINYIHQEMKFEGGHRIGLWLAPGMTLFSAISEMVQLYQDRQDDQERM